MSEPVSAETVEGVVERVLYRSDDGQFAVLLVREDGKDGVVKAAGPLGDAGEGQLWRLSGEIEEHPKYGARLKVSVAFPVTPSTNEGLRRYLGGGRFAGIGAKAAKKLVARYGSRTLDVLAGDEEIALKGLKKEKLQALREAVRADRLRAEALGFLAGLGLGPSLSQKALDRFGERTVAAVREDPFALADEVRGIGFATADGVASALGVRGEHPARLRAGVLHALRQAAEQGHVALPRSRLVAAAARVLVADPGVVEEACGAAVAAGRLVEDDAGGDEPLCYLPFLHAAEREAASLVGAIGARRPLLAADAPVPDFPDFLSDEQRTAVELLLRRPLALLTGGPGVGKTTVLKAWVAAAEGLGRKILLAAPTGRAARRMEEATGRPAATLHRLLGLLPSEIGVAQLPTQAFDCDALAVDETSMLDLVLFTHVLRSLPPHASLVLVGDPHQLPSVGPGDVLAALLRSGAAPVARLTKIFRQDESGLLVPNAHRVLGGRLPEPPAAGAVSDYYFMERETAEEGALLVRDLVVDRLPKKFGFDPREDVQVLCPMHRGPVGTEGLNRLLQDALNAGEPALKRGDRVLRRGDRVIALKNDYVRFVANGEVGRVVSCDPEVGSLEVVFGQKLHVYRGAELDELAPAFALTVHKSQGSEYPAVVLPLFTDHFPMLRRAVVYTAMTRAKRILVVVGQKRALQVAVAEARRAERFGALDRRLGGRGAAAADDV
jgi:exodeoxyribonuclease V alpha subunit